ncbi:MAG: DNA mismatch repair endonuclease MutL, partial [Parachlamydiaceae bacterium]|nr:DNA mismatch repair endonuclease MutL [Parachlamydiaceae bacterium]
MTISKIRLLDEQTINKIAAGEVIENPASVVKELVENAIDAHSTIITIEIQEGGRELIRISDNGIGMSNEDALLSLERHATSKIREVEDIEALQTMGFRGEAIPSIASISKFSLLTSDEAQSDGTLLIVEGGHVLSCSTAARSKGTTIEVKSLFYNVPVRRKFQKSPSFDTQEI